MIPEFILRPAKKTDADTLSAFLNNEEHVHRHLDWRSTQDWLGLHPFWLITQRKRILASLACPPDPPSVAWIRLFASSTRIGFNEAWQLLFNSALQELSVDPHKKTFAAVALQDWFIKILQNNHFYHHQDIVVLEWQEYRGTETASSSQSIVRQMTPEDLPVVELIDNTSFQPIWQISREGLTLAYQQSAYATVAELDGEVVAYQMSTRNPYSAHLARLAVLPHLHGQRIGQSLMYNLINNFSQANVIRLTVNTQSDNAASIGLYQKLGFRLTGETFPVFLYQNKN
jgi:ribosomal protein S18 acetylase RimI-like enzyme